MLTVHSKSKDEHLYSIRILVYTSQVALSKDTATNQEIFSTSSRRDIAFLPYFVFHSQLNLAKMLKTIRLLFIMAYFSGFAWGQNPNHAQFAPMPFPPADGLRTGSGAPGAEYWQNTASYQIKVSLIPEAHTIRGRQTITYTNHSPDTLPFLWVQMEQNLFKPNSAGQLKQPPESRWRGSFADGGLELPSLTVMMNGKRYTPKTFLNDTRLRVDLEAPLAAKGGIVQLEMEWSFVMPEYGADRMGRFDAEQGMVYQLAQWYPRMCVYDATDGWNTMPYLGQGEFHLDYGNYDLEITAPSNMIVVASGSLLNPEAVLTTSQFQRYQQAKNTATTVKIVKPEEVGTPINRPQGKDALVWKFRAENVRDVAWAASAAFIWDAATVDGVWLASAYPKEGLGDSENPGWEESTQMMAHSLKEYSTRWMKYPYPSMTNVAGVVGGMEYPMIIFCAVGDRGESLFGVTDHEFGHIYYPMIVGSDERRHAWMDEGFNTFINFYATLSYYKQDPKSFWQNTAEQITFYSQMRYWDQPLTTAPDLTVPDALGLLAYYKPAYGLVLLREYILGPESFDAAFRAYTERWKYKHPQPQDFFRTIEDVSGEDLAWFWRGWFYSNERYDVGIQNIEVGSGVMTLTLKKNKPLVLPQILEITYQNNTKERIKLPAVIWHMGDTFTKSLPTKGKVLKVQLDPDKLLPDQNRANDAWKSKN